MVYIKGIGQLFGLREWLRHGPWVFMGTVWGWGCAVCLSGKAWPPFSFSHGARDGHGWGVRRVLLWRRCTYEEANREGLLPLQQTTLNVTMAHIERCCTEQIELFRLRALREQQLVLWQGEPHG